MPGTAPDFGESPGSKVRAALGTVVKTLMFAKSHFLVAELRVCCILPNVGPHSMYLRSRLVINPS